MLNHDEALDLHMVRVVGELTQLEDKIQKLENFINSDLYVKADNPRLLEAQVGVMKHYASILRQRLGGDFYSEIALSATEERKAIAILKRKAQKLNLPVEGKSIEELEEAIKLATAEESEDKKEGGNED